MMKYMELVLLICGIITFVIGAASDMFNISLQKPYFEYITLGFFLFIASLLLGISRKLDESKSKPE